MKVLTYLICVLFMVNLYAQQADDADRVIQQFLQQRKKMMEDIMKAFDDDEFFKEGDVFGDKMFDQIRKHGFRGFEGFHSNGNNVKVEEVAKKDGSIDVIITPKNKKIKLDIQTTKNKIVIKSEMMEDVENKNKQGTTKSYSKSSYSQTIRIPSDFTAQSPRQDGDSIVISLIPKAKGHFKPDSKGRVPVQKGYGEDTL